MTNHHLLARFGREELRDITSAASSENCLAHLLFASGPIASDLFFGREQAILVLDLGMGVNNERLPLKQTATVALR